MKERDAGSAPISGQRFSYVIIQKNDTCTLYEKSEDTKYAQKNKIPLDYLW